MNGLSAFVPALASTAELIASDLARVDERFRAQLETPIRPVAELVAHVERYRGKMLRPTLLLLTSRAADPALEDPTDEQVTAAAVVEMIHMATLVHDDVLDEAEIRRGGDTVNKQRGNEAAVVLGDYLISKSFHLCSTLDDQTVALRVGEVTSQVCEGEMLQLSRRGDLTLGEPLYFEIIRRKTACLIALACELGARLAHGDEHIIDAARSYGERIGIAFQIQDDLLDLVGDEAVVGKSLGKDLEKSKLTLPLIHHLAALDSAARDSLARRIRDGAIINGQRLALAQAMERTGSIAYARAAAHDLIAEAKRDLAAFPDSPARHALDSIADAVISRAF
ncbi:MAG: polyprenyl synthetase family protein [Planctomycetota bacterium]|nr:polyprenyl synthetase family protein [Planctomycetota bacterium]